MSERIEFDAESVEIRPNYSTSVRVEVEVRNFSDILCEIHTADIVAAVGTDELLAEIGVDAAKEYWELVEPPEEG